MYLISYDIENDALRLRIAKKLIAWGLYRVQYSVFMGALEREKFPTLHRELEQFSTRRGWTGTDSILVVPIHGKDLKKIEVIGSWPDRWDEISGSTNTIIF